MPDRSSGLTDRAIGSRGRNQRNLPRRPGAPATGLTPGGHEHLHPGHTLGQAAGRRDSHQPVPSVKTSANTA